MNKIAYYDGQVGSPDELMIPFNDRSHFFGDGCYDAALGGNHVVYALDEHIDRFYTSANVLGIRVPMCKQELADLITGLLQKVDGRYHFVYWQVTRGVAERLHTYDEDLEGKLWVFIREEPFADLDTPVDCITHDDERFLYCNAKTINLLPAVLYSQQAQHAGAFETILVRDGYVTECAHSNIHMIKDGVVYTHPNDNQILRGIGKTHMLQTCHHLGITVMEQPFTLDFLMAADEVVITTSSEFGLRVGHVNGVEVGGKDYATLKAIQEDMTQRFLKAVGLEEL